MNRRNFFKWFYSAPVAIPIIVAANVARDEIIPSGMAIVVVDMEKLNG